MTEETQKQEETQTLSDKELNFRRLKDSYEKKLQEEIKRREEIEARFQEKNNQIDLDDDDDDEPYVDKKKLVKTLTKFGEHTSKQTKTEIEKAVEKAIRQEKQSSWLEKNQDFQEVMQHADKLAQQDPEFAQAILRQPESFERQKLVYKHIKALRLHEPPQKEPSIQDKINANRKSPYYQPSSVGNSPYQHMEDFSPEGQKNAYAKMQELKRTLRLG